MKALLIGLAFLLSRQALAVEREPEQKPPNLEPATHYQGATPTDMNNGISWNNGTYGRPNPEYEAWAKAATVVVGLSERPYSYAQKNTFITIMQEQVIWGESAIRNWKSTTSEFPDALAYSKTALDIMNPEFEKLKSSSAKASSAGESNWQSAEADARKALIDFRVAYMSMHKNIQARQLVK